MRKQTNLYAVHRKNVDIKNMRPIYQMMVQTNKIDLIHKTNFDC